MTSPRVPPPPTAVSWPERVFALLFGVFLSLALLKFGNPPIMAALVAHPAALLEWLIFPWPIQVAFPLIAAVGIVGLFALRVKTQSPKWLLAAPLVWLVWQFLAATQSVNADLSQLTVAHFVICVLCFYLGMLALNLSGGAPFFWLPILGAFGLMLYGGLEQHFGGLEATRQYFWTYIYPTETNLPPEYLQKMQSNRIFSTVFYPNAFAGALLLLLPPVGTWIWQAKQHFTPGARVFLIAALAGAAAACLYWTGSKGGWLLALTLGLVTLLHQHFSKRLKLALVVGLVVAGLAGFYWKNREYMQRGATSVVARFDYWQAAWQTAVSKPPFGTGPGTFAIAYAAMKKPESEMARLTHNDYLQQASDSGFPGLLSYLTWIGGLLGSQLSALRLDQNPSWRPRFGSDWWLGPCNPFEFTLICPGTGLDRLALWPGC
jgi:O-antigen ligase